MINTIMEFLATVGDAVMFLWFISKCNQVSLKQKPWTAFWGLGLLVFQLLCDVFRINLDILSILGFSLLSIGFSLSLQHEKWLWAIFSAVLFPAVMMLSSMVVYTVFSWIAGNPDSVLMGSDDSLRAICLIFGKIAQYLLCQLTLWIFRKDRTLDMKNGILFFIFTALSAGGQLVLVKIMLESEADIGFLSFVLACILVILNVILYGMIYQVQNLMKTKYELALMEERMCFEKSRMDEAGNAWNNMRKIRHDMRNHLTVLRGELEKGKTDSCLQYIDELQQSVESGNEIFHSGNAVMDCLVNSKLAGLSDVQVVISGQVDRYDDIEDIDLACILGNILDNAVEAQKNLKADKRIELLFFKKNDNRILICKNAIAKSVLEENKMLHSTKHEADMHGLGHQIVEAKVKKYNGLIDYFEKNGMFGVQIILPERKKQGKNR